MMMTCRSEGLSHRLLPLKLLPPLLTGVAAPG